MIGTFSSVNAKGYVFLAKFQPRPINAGGKLALWVEGGVPDYTWSVTGSDFTLDEATTSTQYNIITAGNDTNYGAAEEVTVTDAGGNSVTIDIVCCSTNNCCTDRYYCII